MSLKKKIYKIAKAVFGKRPIYLKANIIKLTQSELLTGRAALITGGTSGIGFAIADAMLGAGISKVIITGRDKSKCEDAIKSLITAGENRENRIGYHVMDNCDVASFDKSLTGIINDIEPFKLSILVNNAGIQSLQFGEITEDQFDRVIDTNLKGTYFLTQKVARYMVDNDIKGNILNMASSSSLRPASNAYTISKVGIKEFTAGIAKTLIPHGIVVNGIAPGPTLTPMLVKDGNDNLKIDHNPLGRYAMPEEIANMAVILTSGLGQTIVGSIVYMTGGGGIFTYEDVKYPF